MTREPPTRPLIAIIGATGTGKSQLAVALAKRYNGEIINGDAMQLYAGLPIITNKITPDEQQGVPHHLLGCIGMQESPWVVGRYVKEALKTIEGIQAKGRLPILVGGTHYYTQSLLFHDGLAEEEGMGSMMDDAKDAEMDEKNTRILDQPTEILLEELRNVDPVMADRWHPQDRRKIRRSLEIFLKTGKKASEIYAEQRRQKSTVKQCNDPGKEPTLLQEPMMRFPTLLFWAHSDTDALQERLDNRVVKMLEQGLLDEVRTLDKFAGYEKVEGTPIDETRGIWVSIGYKEFKSYLRSTEAGSVGEQRLREMKEEALEKMKIATRQYAKRQIRWIRIKLLNALGEASATRRLYVLDTSHASEFDRSVVEPATALTQQFLQAAPMPTPSSMSETAAELLKPQRAYDLSARPDKWTMQRCGVCLVTCVTAEQWEQHVKSKAHKKLVSKQRQQASITLGRGINQREAG